MLAGDARQRLSHGTGRAMTRRMQAAQLTEQIDKLTRDHQRAKNPEQRNEIFTKLHKAKNQLEELRKLEA